MQSTVGSTGFERYGLIASVDFPFRYAGGTIGPVKKKLTSQNRARLLLERARLLDLTKDAILVRDAADRITF